MFGGFGDRKLLGFFLSVLIMSGFLYLLSIIIISALGFTAADTCAALLHREFPAAGMRTRWHVSKARMMSLAVTTTENENMLANGYTWRHFSKGNVRVSHHDPAWCSW